MECRGVAPGGRRASRSATTWASSPGGRAEPRPGDQRRVAGSRRRRPAPSRGRRARRSTRLRGTLIGELGTAVLPARPARPAERPIAHRRAWACPGASASRADRAGRASSAGRSAGWASGTWPPSLIGAGNGILSIARRRLRAGCAGWQGASPARRTSGGSLRADHVRRARPAASVPRRRALAIFNEAAGRAARGKAGRSIDYRKLDAREPREVTKKAQASGSGRQQEWERQRDGQRAALSEPCPTRVTLALDRTTRTASARSPRRLRPRARRSRSTRGWSSEANDELAAERRPRAAARARAVPEQLLCPPTCAPQLCAPTRRW